MIIIDTNILSEFMTSAPANPVLEWLNAQNAMTLYLTTISIAEINFGLQVMPKSQRRQLLENRLEQFVATAFESRILSFDENAARIYGEIKGYRKEVGQPLSDLSAQISAIARTKGFAVATKNIKDFEECGIGLINPFTVSAQVDKRRVCS